MLTVYTHELRAAARDYVGVESIGAQVIHDLKHRLVDEFCVRLMKPGILGRCQPLLHKRLECFGGHPGVSGRENNFPIRFGETWPSPYGRRNFKRESK